MEELYEWNKSQGGQNVMVLYAPHLDFVPITCVSAGLYLALEGQLGYNLLKDVFLELGLEVPQPPS